MILDDDGTIVAYAMAGGRVKFWAATDSSATNWTLTSTTFEACCNDPVVWRAGGRWYAITAAHGDGTRNFGYETFFTSPALIGPRANWTPLPAFFQNDGSPLIPGHRQQKEFVSPDYIPPGVLPGASSSASVFQASIYGPFQNVSGKPVSGIYNFAMFFVGTQPRGPGTAFVANPRLCTAVDWSCFSPSDVTQGGLDLATGWGATQFGCCPKSTAGIARQIMFGWQQNGGSSKGGGGGGDPLENSMTLPRDLSLGPGGEVLQRYVPELGILRAGPGWHAATLRFPARGGQAGAAFLPAAAAGDQLEIVATIRFEPARTTAPFGLLVLAGPGERTAVVFDPARARIALDRTLSSGGKLDADVRAGPWYGAGSGIVSLHAYVDRSIVTLIIDNRTSISCWVHPQLEGSTGVALFAEVSGVTAEKIAVWRLSDAEPFSNTQTARSGSFPAV